jgi:hypothetical protein
VNGGVELRRPATASANSAPSSRGSESYPFAVKSMMAVTGINIAIVSGVQILLNAACVCSTISYMHISLNKALRYVVIIVVNHSESER